MIPTSSPTERWTCRRLREGQLSTHLRNRDGCVFTPEQKSVTKVIVPYESNFYLLWACRQFFINSPKVFKGIVHPKMKILSLITHPHVVPNSKDLSSSSEQTFRYFWWNLRALWPSIDGNTTTTFKAQKGSKDIIKIVHVIVVQLSL